MIFVTNPCQCCGSIMVNVNRQTRFCEDCRRAKSNAAARAAYHKNREFTPHYDSWIWTATPWCCGDDDSDAGHASSVHVVYTTRQFNELCAYYDYSVAPACILNPAALNLRQSMAYVEEIAE